MKKIFTLLVLCLLSLGMMAQKQISGLVLDSQNEPVIGASVQVKGTSIGTITDYDGEFLLDVPADATTLIVSFIGMKTQEVAIKAYVVDQKVQSLTNGKQNGIKQSPLGSKINAGLERANQRLQIVLVHLLIIHGDLVVLFQLPVNLSNHH